MRILLHELNKYYLCYNRTRIASRQISLRVFIFKDIIYLILLFCLYSMRSSYIIIF